jgi:hypothetical protein
MRKIIQGLEMKKKTIIFGSLLASISLTAALAAPVVPSSIRVGTGCTGSSCTGVTVMSLETYVKRGLNDEWISSWQIESLRAGAVAYRSYGAYYVAHPIKSNYDICSTTSCQVNDSDTATSTDQAANDTAGVVLSRDGSTIFRSEYSAENNAWDDPNDGLSCTNTDRSCGNGYVGSPAAGWPCLADSVATNHGCFGHGRGMSQWGTQRWATSGKGWRWITDHYFNANNNPSGMRSAFMYGGSSGGGTSFTPGARGTVTGMNGLCVDVFGAATGDGTSIGIYTCNGNTAQQWKTTAAHEVRNPLANKCMAVGNGGASVDGAPVVEWTCGGQVDQKWNFFNMEVVAGNSGKCIDVPNSNYADGQALQLFDCNGTAAQKITFEPATGEIKSASGKCFDVSASNSNNGTVVQLWACNGSSAQKWVPGNGGFRTALNTNRCMDLSGNGTANGTRVQIWDCLANGPAQQFALRGEIKNQPGKCLDVPGSNGVAGQALELWACNGAAAQRWTMWLPN